MSYASKPQGNLPLHTRSSPSRQPMVTYKLVTEKETSLPLEEMGTEYKEATETNWIQKFLLIRKTT